MYEELKNKVCQANIELQKHNLVVYSWGNVSEIDRDNNVIAIKPSGVAYEKLTPDKIVLLDIEGNIIVSVRGIKGVKSLFLVFLVC